MKFLILMIICSASFVSCSSQKYIETDLYFGFSKPDGTVINEKAWDSFVADYIAKVYTSGFTQLKSEGKWRDRVTQQLITEPSRVIISVNKMNKSLFAKIDSIRLIYKQLFNQQAVLRVDKKTALVSF